MGLRMRVVVSAETQVKWADGTHKRGHGNVQVGVLRCGFVDPMYTGGMSEQHPDLWERLSEDERLVELEDVTERAAAGASWPFALPEFEQDEERMD